MSDDSFGLKVGATSDEQNSEKEAGIIAAYVLFAIGAVLIVIVCIWLLFYLSRRRRRKRAAAASQTVIYDASTLRPKAEKPVELPTVTYSKPLLVETNNNHMKVPVKIERPQVVGNGTTVTGFNTMTRPAATSTLPKAYVVEDMVDSPRSAPTMVYAVDDNSLRHYKAADTQKVYKMKPEPVYKTLSMDRVVPVRRKPKRSHSDPKVIPVVLAQPPVRKSVPAHSVPAQPVHVIRREERVSEPITQSMPTLLRIQPMNLPRGRRQHHHHNHHHQQQQYQQQNGSGQLYYIVNDKTTTAPSPRPSHVENWVERHHPQGSTSLTRANILYRSEDTLDALDDDGPPPRRTRSWTEQDKKDDALMLRWSPSMKKKLAMKKDREAAINADRVIPAITTTAPDGNTQTYHFRGNRDDGIY